MKQKQKIPSRPAINVANPLRDQVKQVLDALAQTKLFVKIRGIKYFPIKTTNLRSGYSPSVIMNRNDWVAALVEHVDFFKDKKYSGETIGISHVSPPRD